MLCQVLSPSHSTLWVVYAKIEKFQYQVNLLIKTHVLYPPFIIFILSIWEMIYLLLFKVIQSMILMEKKRIINVLQSLEVNKILTSFTFVKKKLCVHSNFFIYFFFWERESIILILFFYVCHIYHNFILFFPYLADG